MIWPRHKAFTLTIVLPNQKAHCSRALWYKTLIWETQELVALTDVVLMCQEVNRRPRPCHLIEPGWLFPVGLKSIAASQRSASNSCFVSCLKSWGPEPRKLPSLCPWIEGRVEPIVSIHFVIKNQRQSKQGGAGREQPSKSLHCWGVRTVQLIQQPRGAGRDVILHTKASGVILSLAH